MAEIVKSLSEAYGLEKDLWRRTLAGVRASGILIEKDLPGRIVGCELIWCTFVSHNIDSVTGGSIQGSIFLESMPRTMINTNARHILVESPSRWGSLTYSACDLSAASFNSAMISGNISACTLLGTSFIDCEFEDVKIMGCKTKGMTMVGCKFKNTEIVPSDETEEDIMDMIKKYNGNDSIEGLINKYTRAHE
jgi:hypothetical protein